MESSQAVLNPVIPEIPHIGITDETIPDAEEPNNELSEESNNEMNAQLESGIINQVTEEEYPGKILAGTEEGGPSLITNKKTSISVRENLVSSRQQSHRSSHLSQRNQQSVCRQSLPTVMPPPDAGTKESVAWLSQRTGKEMKSKVNQTSRVWEIKPLAEILHPSSETPHISEGTEREEADAGETVTPVQDTETEQNATQESVGSIQPLEGTDGQDGSPAPMELEPEHSQQPEEQASQHENEGTIVPQKSLQVIFSEMPSPNDAMVEGNTKLISKRTGKQMKSSFNQTSRVWERKPLSEILGPSRAKTQSPEKDTASPKVEEIKQAPLQEIFPSTPQVEEQELQQGGQQLEALESKQDGGQEVPTEAQEAPEEAPEVQ